VAGNKIILSSKKSHISHFSWDRVVIVRSKLDLTLEQLAEKLGIRESAISRWKLQEAIPRDPTLSKLALLANISVDWSLGSDIPKDSEKQDNDELLNIVISQMKVFEVTLKVQYLIRETTKSNTRSLFEFEKNHRTNQKQGMNRR